MTVKGSLHIELRDIQGVLWAVTGVFHDCYLRTVDIHYCEDEHWFRMVVWVPTSVSRKKRIWRGLLSRTEHAKVPCELRLNGVEAMAMPHTEWRVLMFDDMTYDDAARTIRIRMTPDGIIRLQVTTLSGWLRDISDPTWDGPHDIVD